MLRFFCFRSIFRAAKTTTTTRYATFKHAFWGRFVHKHNILNPSRISSTEAQIAAGKMRRLRFVDMVF